MIFKNIIMYLMSSSRFSFVVTQNLSGMAGFFQRHFSGTDNLRVVSIILLLLAFVLFLFLVVILYIKSLLSFIKNDVTPAIGSGTKSNATGLVNELETEKAKEQTLEREIEQANEAKQREKLRNKQKNESIQKRREAEEIMREKNARMIEENYRDSQIPPRYAKASVMDKQFNSYSKNKEATRQARAAKEFDWRKGQVIELDEATAGIDVFRYEPTYKPLDSMTGLILNMFSRNIDNGKIAQTVRSRCGDKATEEDVIQLIDAIKNFISLCNNGKFDKLPDSQYLPTADDALYNLSSGDASYCLSMLENLMNTNIDKGQNMKMVQKRDIAFMEASNYACTFGTLAMLNDKELAISSFELAIELSPKNVNAWSRVADAYSKAGFTSKAIWAYQNVINIADEDIYPHQVANANIQLSQHYYSQGDKVKAVNLFNYGNDYYESIGITKELTQKEEEIIDIIESRQQENIETTISKLLNISTQRRAKYGY